MIEKSQKKLQCGLKIPHSVVMEMETKKICKHCGKQFLKENTRNCDWTQKKYCSNKCKQNEKYKRYKTKFIENALKRYKANRDKILSQQNEYIKKRYKEDDNFRKKFLFRRKSAKKIDLTKEKCEICGNKEDLQRHHLNYINLMDVKILCRFCHNIQHHLQRG